MVDAASSGLEPVLARFVALGGELVDSSPMYGHAEAVIGELAARLGVRHRLFLATKVWTRGHAEGVRQMETSFSRCGTVTLTQNGTEVEGTYADGDGEIEGTASGTRLNGSWSRNNSSGDLQFFALENGERFNGNFDDTFPWCGHRAGADFPEPCVNDGTTVFPIFPPIVVTLQPFIPPIVFPTPTATPTP